MRSPVARPLLSIALLATVFGLFLSTGNHSGANPDSSQAQQDVDEVAREILKIQQEIGGSVVDLPSAELVSPSLNTEELVISSANIGEKDQEPVTALREASLQLDLVAHRLELLDLYSQSDATRELAQRLRQDARALKRPDHQQN